jgi:hypothetical protein
MPGPGVGVTGLYLMDIVIPPPTHLLQEYNPLIEAGLQEGRDRDAGPQLPGGILDNN